MSKKKQRTVRYWCAKCLWDNDVYSIRESSKARVTKWLREHGYTWKPTANDGDGAYVCKADPEMMFRQTSASDYRIRKRAQPAHGGIERGMV